MTKKFDTLSVSFKYGGNNAVSNDYETVEDVAKYLGYDVVSMVLDAIATLRGNELQHRQVVIDITKFAEVSK